MNISVNRLKKRLKGYKLREKLKTYGREAVAYLFNYMKSPSPGQVRVILFAQGRTGSTLLESLLCSTGHFRRNGELLNSKRNGEILLPIPYICGLSNWKSYNNFIFHLKIYHLTKNRKRSVNPTQFIKTLYAKDWKVIYLRRKNAVKHTLSNIVAEHRGDYHKLDDTKEELKICIDCESFAARICERFRFEDAEKEVLSNIEYLEVVYEDDLENSETHQSTVNKILDYLSLEHREASTNHRKVNTLPLMKLISNYDEFVTCMQQHGWQNYLL